MFQVSRLRPMLGLLAFSAFYAAPTHAQNLLVANKASGTIESITPVGAATQVASGLNGPTGLAVDSAGDLFVANNGSGVINKYAYTNGALSTTPTAYYTQSGAAFQGLTLDSAGNLYAAASATNSVVKITAANTGSTFYTGTGTTALNAPYSLAFDSTGSLYVSNINSGSGANANSIVKITAGVFSTFSTATVTAYGLAFDSKGTLYATNANANNVLSYTNAGGAGTVFAFTTSNGITLANPHGAAFDSSGNLYVANTGGTTPAIIKIAPNGTETTFDTAGLSSPVGLAFSVTPVPAPEPAPRTALAIGAAGLGALALTAKKRASTTK